MNSLDKPPPGEKSMLHTGGDALALSGGKSDWLKTGLFASERFVK